jgi:hypothetical protein
VKELKTSLVLSNSQIVLLTTWHIMIQIQLTLRLHKLKMGDIHFIKSFIHYVHFHEETNPIGNDWQSITMDDFDHFRGILQYTCRFSSLSCLPPIDMMYVDNVPNFLDLPDVFNEIDVLDVTDVDHAPNAFDVSNALEESDIFTVTDVLDVSDVIETTDISNVIDVAKVLDVTNITDIIYISDDSYDLSLASDILQVTTTGEIKRVHHHTDIKYEANGPPNCNSAIKYEANGPLAVLSSGLTQCPSRPPGKPPCSTSVVILTSRRCLVMSF